MENNFITNNDCIDLIDDMIEMGEIPNLEEDDDFITPNDTIDLIDNLLDGVLDAAEENLKCLSLLDQTWNEEQEAAIEKYYLDALNQVK